MKMKRLIKASMLLMVAALLAACANEDITQQDNEKKNEAPKGGVVFATNDTKISAKRRFIDEDEFAGAKTRTDIKHTPGNGADAYWTSDDYIWVKKQDGIWAKSTAITLHDGGASAEFTLPGNKTDYADGCEVRYTTAGSYFSHAPANLVYFPQNQSRTIANDFSKAGEWGDCGSGVAHNTGNPDKFNFTLSHKSSYLCFLPRCTNAALAPNIRLKGIKVTANQATNNASFFPGFHSFNGDDIDYIGTPTIRRSIEITLPDFPLSTTENQAANATYLVVPPDTYDFKIEYTCKIISKNIEGTITKTFTNKELEKGLIYDIMDDLVPPTVRPNVKNYKYYMWDAAIGQDYWHGYESEQPTIPYNEPGGTQSQHYPQNSSDSRWFHQGNGHLTANQSCKDCPNVNELWWYIWKGDPHVGMGFYVEDGRLQQTSGIWLKKKSAIVAYLKAKEHYPASFTVNDLKDGYKTSADAAPVDYRVRDDGATSRPYSVGTPTNIADYFFLPLLGYYYKDGWLRGFDTNPYLGSNGIYWSSSTNSGEISAYSFSWTEKKEYGSVGVSYGIREGGNLVRAFE